MDSGFQKLDSSLCQWSIGFRILIVSGIPRIPWAVILDSKAQDSRIPVLRYLPYMTFLDRLSRNQNWSNVIFLMKYFTNYIHTGFHRFTEIGQSLHGKYIL